MDSHGTSRIPPGDLENGAQTVAITQAQPQVQTVLVQGHGVAKAVAITQPQTVAITQPEALAIIQAELLALALSPVALSPVGMAINPVWQSSPVWKSFPVLQRFQSFCIAICATTWMT